MFTASEAAKEKTYSEAEIKARIQQELPRWIYEGGWIRRNYKTASWKGKLMGINTIGHLAEAAWHHPGLNASYAWVEVRLQNHAAKGITDKDFDLAKKSRTLCFGSPERKAALWKARPRISVLRTSTIRKAKHRWRALRRSDRDLPAYFDDAVAWKTEEIADVHGVSLHHGEECLLPLSQTLPVAPVNDRFAGDVIGDVVGIEGAALLARLSQEGRNVWPLHESIARRRAPEIGGHLNRRQALGLLDPRDGFRHDPENEQMIVQGPVVLDVPDHDRRGVTQGPGKENRCPGNTRNPADFDRVHELADRNSPLAKNLCDRCRPTTPNQHDAIDNAGQKQRNIAAVGDLHEIREEEAGIDAEEGAGDRPAREQPPAPNLTHGDEQEHRGHKHSRGNSDAVGGGQIVGLAEEQRQTRPDQASRIGRRPKCPMPA